ncbi:potassium-transporting ATPase subunit B, partial [mine drainage metagenome]
MVELAYKEGLVPHEFAVIGRVKFEEFSASTRRSEASLEEASDFILPKGGRDILQRKRIRRKYDPESKEDVIDIIKGAPDAIKLIAKSVPLNYDTIVDEAAKNGDTIMTIAEGGEVLGLIRLRDEVKPGVKSRISAVKNMGIKTVMITGDQEATASSISREVGIDEYVSRAKPEAKYDLVKKEQAQGRIVAMIGDGTNDAPALAASDVGIAMASGTEPAKEAANMVDMESNPAKVID